MEEGDHNMVVRRAQEAVELALKGGLSVLGVEYPKVHDVGRLFAEAAAAKLAGLDSQVLDRIARISTMLSEERSPAFYGERVYGREEAEGSRRQAAFVVASVEKMIAGHD